MMRFALAVVLVQIFPVSADAENDLTMTMISGNCQIAQVASKSELCATPASVVYSRLPNGIILFNVPLADGRVFGFVGDRDSQPKPEEYLLYLKRVRLARGSEPGTPVDVAGTCKASMTADGTIVHRIVCDAEDSQGSKFLLDFRGDDQPVVVKHF